MEEFDIIIIGGSANGSQTAWKAAEKGLSVAVIEQHEEIGFPEHCSGLFSYTGLQKIDIAIPESIVFNPEIYGARIISPNGKVLTVSKPEVHALVCDRAAYDQFVMNKAVDAGVTLFQPFRAMQAYRKEGKVVVTIKKGDEELSLMAPLLISAEGVKGSIAKQLGLQGPPRVEWVNAVQFYMKNLKNMDVRLVEVIQHQEYAEDFFAWVIPMDNHTAKVGLGTKKKGATKVMSDMIAHHPVLKQRCEGAEIVRKTAGRIPITGPVKTTYADNLLLVGDVAGQSKPTTGGGVILGGIAAGIAAEVAAEALHAGDFSASFLKRYQKRWKKTMMTNFRMMRLVRYYMNYLKDDEVDTLFALFEKKGLISDIETYGDVDNQASLVRRFMTTFSLYPFYLKTSGRLLKSLLKI
ncbi:MAG: NAD(P)/FAD-dependent oxidoreductase [Candidatus Heimdallarchaeota archaeon]|nr:NAD(P)/FAD-dependent oxidoreductase [Candidatus Heimdallarchaeota archaeon]